MKRLIIICEGPTEQAFCNDVLHGHLLTKDIVLEAPTIKHSNGGIVAWDTLKKQIVRHLNEVVVCGLLPHQRFLPFSRMDGK